MTETHEKTHTSIFDTFLKHCVDIVTFVIALIIMTISSYAICKTDSETPVEITFTMINTILLSIILTYLTFSNFRSTNRIE